MKAAQESKEAPNNKEEQKSVKAQEIEPADEVELISKSPITGSANTTPL